MGTKSQKKAKTRLDAYYRLAKDQGYRSRAAYKLIQLNRKYDFLGKSKSLVDLCAAPGGWCQVAAKHMPIGSKIIGVDLVPIPPVRGVKTFVGDITDDKTRKMIMTYLKKEPVDCVIHDGAPNVGGVWSKDLFSQNALVLASLKMAASVLRVGGWFVSKVFRSGDFHKIIWVLKQFFDKVEATKPLASRMESAEIFVVCGGYKAPKNIDQKLFSAQHVFSDVGPEKVMTASGALVTPKTNVPQGYEQFNTIDTRIATIDEFLRAENPKDFLRSMHEIRFNKDSADDRRYLAHKTAKKELVYLCQDLQQVGEADRKRLLRWRDQLLRTFPLAAVGPEADGAVDSDDDEAEAGGLAMPDEAEMEAEARAAASAKGTADDVETIATELLRIRKAHERELKRKQKRLIDRKLKQVRGLINHDPYESGQHPTDMSGHFDDDANDADMAEGDWALASIRKLGEEDMAEAFDQMMEEHDEQLNLPINVPMNVNLDNEAEVDYGGKGDEFDEEERLHVQEGNEEQYDVDAYGNYVRAERSERVAKFDGPSDEDEEDDFEGDDVMDAKFAAAADADDEEEEGEEDGDQSTNYFDSDDDAAAGGSDAEEESPEDRKKRERKERDEAALDEVGGQAKWQRRHLNIDQVLNRTFPKPRDSRAAKKDAKKQARLEEDRVEMTAAPASSSAGKKRGGKRDADDEEVIEHPLHDEGDLSDSDAGRESDDDDEDDHEFSDLSADEDEGNAASYGVHSKFGKDHKRVLLPSAKFLNAQELTKQQRKAVTKDNKEKRKVKREAKKVAKQAGKKGKKSGEDTSFEEIPLAMTDPEVRDRTLAMATAMLDKGTRSKMLENAINRYTHNDDDELPDWFVKDEQRNCFIPTPVTAYDVEQQRLRFREMTARPSKKVAEAMGRKRKRATRLLKGLVEKGRTDPRAREKTAGLSVRKLLRSKNIKGVDNKKKNAPMDNKVQGEKKRERARLRQQKKGKGRSHRR